MLVGCELDVQHRGGFVYGIKGSKGQVNQGGNLCNSGRFGYQYMNDVNRLLKPRVKENGSWKDIEWNEAFEHIAKQLKSSKPSESAFTVGARLSNEEQYFIQKIARAGVKTNNISSFHYMERGKGYTENSVASVPFNELKFARAIWVLSPEMIKSNGVAAFAVQSSRKKNGIPVTLIVEGNNHLMDHKADRIIAVKSRYAFIKAINYYLVHSGKLHASFINECTEGFDAYKQTLLKEDYSSLIYASGLAQDVLESLAEELIKIAETVMIYAEAGTSSNCAMEINNLMLLSGKPGKTGSGVIALKSKNNSQGLRDNGICPKTAPGGRKLKDAKAELEALWQINDLCVETDFSIKERLKSGAIKNLFIFGEDPIGTAMNADEVKSLIPQNAFVVVADYFMTASAEAATLVLPMAFPFESGGSYTNTQRIIQRYEAEMKPKTGKNNIEMLNGIAEKVDVKPFSTTEEIFLEFASLLTVKKEVVFSFSATDQDNPSNMFVFGADNLVLRHQKRVMELLKK